MLLRDATLCRAPTDLDLLFYAPLHSTPHHTPLYLALLNSAPLDPTLLHSTLKCTILSYTLVYTMSRWTGQSSLPCSIVLHYAMVNSTNYCALKGPPSGHWMTRPDYPLPNHTPAC